MHSLWSATPESSEQAWYSVLHLTSNGSATRLSVSRLWSELSLPATQSQLAPSRTNVSVKRRCQIGGASCAYAVPQPDPAFATAAYSYYGLRWLAARIAVRMSGPPNVGRGELSTIARKKSPSAPKRRNIEVTPCPRRGRVFWMTNFNMSTISTLLDCFSPGFLFVGRQTAVAARRGDQTEAQKHVAAAKAILDKGTIPEQARFFPYPERLRRILCTRLQNRTWRANPGEPERSVHPVHDWPDLRKVRGQGEGVGILPQGLHSKFAQSSSRIRGSVCQEEAVLIGSNGGQPRSPLKILWRKAPADTCIG